MDKQEMRWPISREIDENFITKVDIDRANTVFTNVLDGPFQVHGLMYENGKFRRLPEKVAQSVSEKVRILHSYTAGGRVRFQTDSPFVAISVKYDELQLHKRTALPCNGGFDLYRRENGKELFCSLMGPEVDSYRGYEGITRFATAQMRELTLNFPLRNEISELSIGLMKGSAVLPPKGYTVKTPVVFYGSSITQGFCASRPGCCYESILSRRLDFDYINLGFSGAAHGEREMAEYIADMQMSALVYDYDHNAHTLEELASTHEPMFRLIREKQPNLPILMLSRPRAHLSDLEAGMQNIVRQTYLHAKAAGDANVYFIPGDTLFEEDEAEISLVDGVHPNDNGFSAMARKIAPVLEQMLQIKA